MPAPSNPPYEAGALLSPRQLNRWLDVNPVEPLTRTRGYFVLPAFTVQQPRGTGYANIIAVFNYTAKKNFSLKSISGLSRVYVLCISWADENGNMHRYALWPNVTQTFYFPLVPYAHQVIQKNFRLEVWNGDYITQLYQNLIGTEDGTGSLGTEDGNFLVTEQQAYAPELSVAAVIVQPTPITFETSILGEYDYMWQDDFVVTNPSPIVTDFYFPLNNPLTPPVNSTPVINIV